jgi:hypothetical protein
VRDKNTPEDVPFLNKDEIGHELPYEVSQSLFAWRLTVTIMAVRPITHPRATNMAGKLYLSTDAIALLSDSTWVPSLARSPRPQGVMSAA